MMASPQEHSPGGLRGAAAEQAALRRVATLVARAAPPEEVFAAVTAEVGRLLHAQRIWMAQYEPDGAIWVVAAWPSAGAAGPIPIGTQASTGGRNVSTLVFQTGRRRGSTTTPTPRARSGTSPTSSASAQRSGCRSSSRDACGAS